MYYADSKIPTEIRNRFRTLISLRVIPKIKWQDTIRNEELRTPSKKLVFGHGDGLCAPLRRPDKNSTRLALPWEPQGKIGRGRSRDTGRRDVEKDMRGLQLNWNGLERRTHSRDGWTFLVSVFCPVKSEGH